MLCPQEDIWLVVVVVSACRVGKGGHQTASHTHAHQHAIKRHTSSQRGVSCQLLHVSRLHAACVPRIGARVSYFSPLPPTPCFPSSAAWWEQDRLQILESSNKAATTAYLTALGGLLTDDDGDASPIIMLLLPFLALSASGV